MRGPRCLATAQAPGAGLTRDGFDLSRHQCGACWPKGELGWLQITNFAVTGLMVVAFVVGLHRALAFAGHLQLRSTHLGVCNLGRADGDHDRVVEGGGGPLTPPVSKAAV